MNDQMNIEELNKAIDNFQIQLDFAMNVKIIANIIGIISSVISIALFLDNQEHFIIVVYLAFNAFFLAFFFYKDKENKLLRSILNKNTFLINQRIEQEGIKNTVAYDNKHR